jgi:hypothetical protein
MTEKEILQIGDWVLRWSPHAEPGETGFALYTPNEFDPEKGNGPIGGIVLAAVYFILKHGSHDFPQELISKANDLAKELAEQNKQSSSMKSPPGRTLN